MARAIGYEPLTRYVNCQPDNPGEDIVPDIEINVAEGVDVNDDGTEYIFHLREGLKWSDGEPYDAHDITFWYDHVFTNKELLPSHPRWSVAGGEPVKVEIDQYTVKFSFATANGLLLTFAGDAIPGPRTGTVESADDLSGPLSRAVPPRLQRERRRGGPRLGSTKRRPCCGSYRPSPAIVERSSTIRNAAVSPFGEPECYATFGGTPR